MFTGVPAKLVPKVWADARPFIERSLEGCPEFTADDAEASILAQEQQLWIFFEGGRVCGAGTTQIVVYPRSKVCFVHTWSAEVDRQQWLAGLRDVEAWAKAEGCSVIRIPQAREGWRRVMPEYRQRAVVLERTL